MKEESVESSTLLQDVDRAGGVREEVVVVDQGNVGGGDYLQLLRIIINYHALLTKNDYQLSCSINQNGRS